MRKLRFVPALIVLLVALWASSASAIGNPQTFSLLEVSVPENDRALGDFTFDRPPVGGDQFTVTNALYKWAGTRKGARVGRVRVLHTFVTGFGSDLAHRATVLFVAQVYLPGGTVLLQGYGQVNPNDPSNFTLPIVGGTGTYANVRGSVTVRNLSQTTTNVKFHLLP